MPVLYLRKTSTQLVGRTREKIPYCICVFHVGFVTIQSSIALLTREDIWPSSVGVKSCKTREAYKIQLSTHFFDTQIKYN